MPPDELRDEETFVTPPATPPVTPSQRPSASYALAPADLIDFETYEVLNQDEYEGLRAPSQLDASTAELSGEADAFDPSYEQYEGESANSEEVSATFAADADVLGLAGGLPEDSS